MTQYMFLPIISFKKKHQNKEMDEENGNVNQHTPAGRETR